ncbi:hypothetical protein G7Y89_g15561 [Cudoniella acicularis]|uniref:Uncharacterized protein n=1 Tax=Cudoniella acicularis TaxID=354080 RepID=A0A8H4QKK0_9HELO|nr:hypothetical protein G7Y89_g15561 [Cudoniella acicularis]
MDVNNMEIDDMDMEGVDIDKGAEHPRNSQYGIAQQSNFMAQRPTWAGSERELIEAEEQKRREEEEEQQILAEVIEEQRQKAILKRFTTLSIVQPRNDAVTSKRKKESRFSASAFVESLGPMSEPEVIMQPTSSQQLSQPSLSTNHALMVEFFEEVASELELKDLNAPHGRKRQLSTSSSNSDEPRHKRPGSAARMATVVISKSPSSAKPSLANSSGTFTLTSRPKKF